MCVVLCDVGLRGVGCNCERQFEQQHAQSTPAQHSTAQHNTPEHTILHTAQQTKSTSTFGTLLAFSSFGQNRSTRSISITGVGGWTCVLCCGVLRYGVLVLLASWLCITSQELLCEPSNHNAESKVRHRTNLLAKRKLRDL